MITTQARLLLSKLENRRCELGISRAALAKRSRVPLTTVNRVLSRAAQSANLASAVQIAAALGMEFFVEQLPAQQVRERKAKEKAQELVGMVQATSGLEGQAVDGALVTQMTEQTVHELLAGSSRRLWSD